MSETKLQLLGVGTGRDGTVSVTELVNRIYQANGIDGKAVHEYAAWDCYANHSEFCETGKHKFLGAIDAQIRQCPNAAIIGNGYAFVLDRFAALSAGRIRLLHVRRRDRAACIKSIVENVRFNPSAHRYYSDSPEARLKRTTAFHLGEMTRAEWDTLPIEARVAWFYDATHREIEAREHLFAAAMTIETETLSSPECLARLTEFVLGRPGIAPEAAHLNKYVPLDYSHLPEHDRLMLHFNFHSLDLGRAAHDEAYLIEHFTGRFVESLYRLLSHREDNQDIDDAYLGRLLQRAQQIFAMGLAHVQVIGKDLPKPVEKQGEGS